MGLLLSWSFTALGFTIFVHQSNRIKGFAYALGLWLLLAVLYDALFLLVLVYFSSYDLTSVVLVFVLCNPLDLARILVIMASDLSALLGYTGAVFEYFLGGTYGLYVCLGILLLWIIVPLALMHRRLAYKDF